MMLMLMRTSWNAGVFRLLMFLWALLPASAIKKMRNNLCVAFRQ